ncbi:GntR family transcriptional regulator [Cellulomonas fimi]|uniref:Transcriptional regulator, GntR family n=1 Tax=Cellulomonas fimi (strain ATCC 484 / DSM 20113 / JCM 1341 / CCUG 24087 / LMG 16345 / NBRC 15513 / NCIMB 8980 / NCTC 7547 / NRS-133) TaxID=590998 RepID=F4H1U8_CELFA|nr:GntR family transcriptional regulator [Cellulomonas fimi]AEE47518.1 transcriptional regulator, GntR family [Cellulomonas fimi ATCC 484]NNH05506.1 GntR family transcriptional regulator [Cellulomonas fimi]VEH36447.1 HTH-type transcriptional repressor yvoA [Cellulomonas fimi]
MFDGRDPLYVQIADQIRQDVLSGALEAEEQVMSTTQYATTFRINPATAAKAFGELVDEGVLYKRRGVGMFVAPGAREKLRAERRDSFFADVVDPMMEQARLLGIDVDEVVARLRATATDTPQAGAR